LGVRFRWMTSLSHPGECDTALFMCHLQDAAFSGIVWDLVYRQGENSDFVLHVAIVREQDYFLNDGMIAMRNFRDDGSEQTRSLLIQVGSLTTRAALAASPEGTGAGSLEIFFVRAPARQRLLFSSVFS